jgi:hypothetical protein
MGPLLGPPRRPIGVHDVKALDNYGNDLRPAGAQQVLQRDRAVAARSQPSDRRPIATEQLLLPPPLALKVAERRHRQPSARPQEPPPSPQRGWLIVE